MMGKDCFNEGRKPVAYDGQREFVSFGEGNERAKPLVDRNALKERL